MQTVRTVILRLHYWNKLTCIDVPVMSRAVYHVFRCSLSVQFALCCVQYKCFTDVFCLIQY